MYILPRERKRTVWKYPLWSDKRTSNVDISMPKGAELLDVQVQDGKPMLWALVDVGVDEEERSIRVAGTGHEIIYHEAEQNLRWFSTFLMPDEGLVFHVFEVVPVKSGVVFD